MAAESLTWLWSAIRFALGTIVLLLVFYTLRHMWFTW